MPQLHKPHKGDDNMNQNQPPRGPGNPYYGTEGRDNPGDSLSAPTPNQQNPYPTPPQPGGHAPWGHNPGGYPVPPAAPGHAPGPGYGAAPGHGHYPPHPPGYTNPHDTAVMSTKDWLLMLLVMLIPCVNIIMLFVWAFSGTGNHNRRNYCRAYLLLWAILIGLYFAVIFFLFVFGFGIGFFSVFL